MEDTGKRGLGQKLKDKLHIGHSSKGSAASDESGYSNQGQVLCCHIYSPSCQLTWQLLYF